MVSLKPHEYLADSRFDRKHNSREPDLNRLKNHRLPALLGLWVALGGPAILTSPAARILGDPARLRTQIFYQLTLWTLLGLLLAIVIGWEKQSLSSIGLTSWRWQSLSWGLGCTACIAAISAITIPYLTRIGVVDLSRGLAVVASWPFWFRMIAVVTAGVAEEPLFRGYAIDRLASLTGSYCWAGVISLAVFGLVHVPLWGVGILFSALFGGSVFTLLYIWRRDLWSCTIAHIVAGAIALIVGPMLHHEIK